MLQQFSYALLWELFANQVVMKLIRFVEVFVILIGLQFSSLCRYMGLQIILCNITCLWETLKDVVGLLHILSVACLGMVCILLLPHLIRVPSNVKVTHHDMKSVNYPLLLLMYSDLWSEISSMVQCFQYMQQLVDGSYNAVSVQNSTGNIFKNCS